MSGLQPKEPKAFLTAARVKQGVYLLGCNHRQITFYSQQTRAVNLVYSLLQTGELQEGKLVAVVGAGVSGLTAAGFAADCGCRVGLYEKEKKPLTIQRDCESRWVHPHIYDWPERGSLNDDTGDLPILNWTAGRAKDVIEQIGKAWQALSQRHSDKISFYPQSVIGSKGSQQASLLLSELTEKYDVVILAIGFGKEPERFGTKPYWVDEVQNQQGAQWLISGFGDGALADLMQICIPDFRHEELKSFVDPVDSQTAKALLAKEDEGSRDPKELNRYYEEELQVPAVLDRLRPRVDTNRQIVIQGKAGSHLYGSTSAIINRFVISHIQRLYKNAHGKNVGKFFRVLNEEWTGTPSKKDGAVFHVAFEKYGAFKGMLVVRHGPESVLKEYFPDLWNETQRDRELLRDLPQQLDPTRLPILQEAHLWDVKRRTLSGEWWCLVLVKESQLERLMGWALPKLKSNLTKWFLHIFGSGVKQDEALKRATQPSFIPLSAALRDAATYRTTVRALCRANVVIADVTEFDPGMMLLLGIRAAVRRGVTIVSSANRPKLSDYNDKIPFNLRELSILDHSGIATDKKATEFSNAIEKGMDHYLYSTNYQDLPAYAHVRLPDINWPDNDVIVLCPFSEKYEKHFAYLYAELKYITDQQANCRRVIDDPSPWLNSQRLFGAIRHADTCLIDWSGWRHNVFFELGVRLAVHPKGAICVLNPEYSSEPKNSVCEETSQLLQNLFEPSAYETLKDAWQLYKKEPDEEKPDSSLGRGETYRIVSDAVETENQFFIPVHNLLLSSVTNTIRNNPGNVDIDELYAMANDTLPLEYQKAGRERLLAAWYYLENRFQPSRLTEDNLRQDDNAQIAKDYIQVCDELVRYLKAVEFRDLRRDVNTKKRELRKRLEGLKK
jgi:hypothetical protein